jgi:EAL domain-containing protein (putative c-di-GMP-specific phosphodiesterase class I)
MVEWCVERLAASELEAIVPIERFPFLIGRDASCDLSVAAAETSRQHARIERAENGALRITDLNSGNGTFVNRARVRGSVPINDGDVLHFGTTEFRLRRVDAKIAHLIEAQSGDQTILFRGGKPVLSEHFVVEERRFLDMIAMRDVKAVFQPIVRTHDGRTQAFEVLGRGCAEGLPESPMELFTLAARLGKEVELSEVFRWAGMSSAAAFGSEAMLFLNTHPKETFSEALYRSIAELRSMLPRARLVIEVHETAVTRVEDVRAMAEHLASMQVQFAYDDFGAGQARLLELAEVPPHFVKFDMSLIRGLDNANLVKRQLVEQLVHIVHNVGSIALAEGVESPEEARVCVDLGFDLIQGYLTGVPKAPEDVLVNRDYASQALLDAMREASVSANAKR